MLSSPVYQLQEDGAVWVCASSRSVYGSGRGSYTCGDLVYGILEHETLKRRNLNLDQAGDFRTNLVTTKAYAKSYPKSQEQLKQYLHQRERMPGTCKIGRDWVIPYDTKFPEELRGKRKTKSNRKTGKKKEKVITNHEGSNQ